MRRPGLRLRLLQMVLGLDRLDGAFSRDVVRHAARLQPSPLHPPHPPTPLPIATTTATTATTHTHTHRHPPNSSHLLTHPTSSTSATPTPPPPCALSRSMASSALRATSSRACRARRGRAPSLLCGETAAMAVRTPAPTKPTRPSPGRTPGQNLTPAPPPHPHRLISSPLPPFPPWPPPPRFAPTSSRLPQAHPTIPSPGALCYADYDEATRLEAEASLYTGSAAARRECASSDPLGEQERLTRVRQLR
jgi:hypothetical protein